jgi:hypothetical protein
VQHLTPIQNIKKIQKSSKEQENKKTPQFHPFKVFIFEGV